MAAQPNPIDIGTFRKIRLKLNKGGYWEVWWTDAAGYLTKRESCRTKVRAEADAYLDHFCATARSQAALTAAPAIPCIEELCQRWLADAELRGRHRSCRWILAAIRNHLGRYTPDQLDTRLLLQDYPAARGVANGSLRRELSALRTVLIWAAKQRLISHDAIPAFDDLPPAGAPRTKFLNPAQEKLFWDHAMLWPDRKIKVFVALGLETAARREAIVELTWDRVDLGLGLIDYRIPGARQTNKRRVRVPISDRLMPVLRETWLQAPKGPGGQATGQVLGPTNPDIISRGFTRFARSTGLPWVTPHVLRHTWGSLKAMKGASLYDIARVMGDTIATIEANYLHLTPDHLRRVVNF